MRYSYLMLVTVAAVAGCGDGVTDLSACGTPQVYTAGTTATGKIEQTDCKADGGNVDVYALTLSGNSGYLFTLSGNNSGGGMSIFSGLATKVDDSKEVLYVDNGQSAKGYLPAGTYTIMIGGSGSGDYSLTSVAANSNGCASNFTMPGMFISAAITDLDCPANGGAKEDTYQIQLQSGQTISVSATLLKQGAVVFHSMTASGDLFTKQMDTPNGGNASFNYTATKAGWYGITVFAEPARFGATGYSLSVN